MWGEKGKSHVTQKNKSHKTQMTLLKDHRSATVTTFLQPGLGASISPCPRCCTRGHYPLQPPFKTKILLYNVSHLFGLCSTPCSSLKKFEDQVIFRRCFPRLYPQTLGRSPVQPFKRSRGHSGFPIGNDDIFQPSIFRGKYEFLREKLTIPKGSPFAEWPGRKTSSPKTPPNSVSPSHVHQHGAWALLPDAALGSIGRNDLGPT